MDSQQRGPVTYPCTQCGACCRRALFVVAATGLDDWAPGFADNGACAALQVDNTCAIYETRPLLCRVDEMREHHGADERDWYEANAAQCNTMQVEDGTPETFRVRLPVLTHEE